MRKFAPLAALIFALTACTSSGNPALKRPASTGHLRFVVPVQAARVPADRVRVKLELTGATLTKETSANISPDVGHVHIKLDGKTISILAGLDEIINDITDTATGKKIGPLTKGPHIVTAEFVAADHGPFDPVVSTTVTIVAV
jgi:hypothetical protein